MPILVRRVQRAKWEQIDLKDSDDVVADAITNCLKTFSNELSFWRVETEAEINEAVLALITGSNQESISTMHIVYFPEDLIEANHLLLNDDPGDTVIAELKKSHRNIHLLNYSTLGNVKDIIVDCFRSDRVKTITSLKLRTLLTESIQSGKVDKSNLNDKLVAQLKLK
jgi:hypothetical protein